MGLLTMVFDLYDFNHVMPVGPKHEQGQVSLCNVS